MNVLPSAAAPSFITLALALALGVALIPPRPYCAHRSDSRTVIKAVELGVVHFQTDNTAMCPCSLRKLVKDKYLTRMPVDSWGLPLRYQCPGRHNRDGADIVSAGPDHRFGTSDDIRSWEL